jgi:glycosyltransferase involved in cell wall biosynthesis
MTITHVISGLRAGGAEHFVLALCKQSAADSNTTMDVLSLGGADDIGDKFKNAGISIARSSGNNSLRAYNALKGVRLLLDKKPHILHAHMFHACMVACIVKILRPRWRIVFTLHNNHVPQLHRRLLLWATKFLRDVDIIFPGMHIKWFQKSDAIPVRNGIDLLPYYGSRNSSSSVFTCAFIGRLDTEKNPLHLVTIAKSLASKFDFTIKVAGDGPLLSHLVSVIKSEGLEQHFQVLGYVENASRVVATSHCLLLPSLWEGLPMALLEAGACGVPVVATPVGGICSLVDTESGFLCPLGEFPAVIEWIRNNYHAALAKAARLKQLVIRDYNIRDSYRHHLTVYFALKPHLGEGRLW